MEFGLQVPIIAVGAAFNRQINENERQFGVSLVLGVALLGW